MLPDNAGRVLELLADDDLVLDVGGWARPFTRADWVIDLMPYESRGGWGKDGPEPERFSPATWVQRDICAREPWPFDDDQFDFAVCAQTLEDVRDPIWVCSELTRVARAGYVEVPSRLVEQSVGVQGNWVGYGHHHWLIDVDDGTVTFTFKHHILHGRAEYQFPRGFSDRLSEDEKVTTLWWDGDFEYRERLFYEPEDLDRYLTEFVVDGMRRVGAAGRGGGDGRGALHRVRGRSLLQHLRRR